MWRRAAAAAIVMVGVLAISSTALADADPASDLLLVANAFYPYGPPVSSRLQSTLNAELTAAHRAHFPIKVALIATPMDLGAIQQLYDKPKQYAAFLDQEISFGAKVPLLVVMPDGDGTAGLRTPVSSLPQPAGRGSAALARVAIAAVPRLANASGHPLGRLGAASSSSTTGGSVAGPLAILVAVCAALAGGILTIRRRRAKPVVRTRR